MKCDVCGGSGRIVTFKSQDVVSGHVCQNCFGTGKIKNVASKKVYCKECKYLKSLCNEGLIYHCCHPENIIVVDSWLGTYNKHKREPSKINENNDCEWFKGFKLTGPPKRL